MSSAPKTVITPSQYLHQERGAAFRSEYYRGETFAMAGAGRAHNLICTNLVRRIAEQLDDRDCEVYQGDMRVKISSSNLYVYPDVVVACEQPEFEDQQLDTLLNPRVLIEVLSESTEKYDRSTKWRHYQSLPSLREYLLVSQSSKLLERYARCDAGQWVYQAIEGDKQIVELQSIDCRLHIENVYAKVTFEPESAPDDQAAHPQQ